MPRRKSAASVVVEFFESGPLQDAVIVLEIVKGIVERRQPKATAKRKTRAPAPLLEEKQAAS